MERKLKILWLVSIPLFVLHVTEEYLAGFPDQDAGIRFFAHQLGTSNAMVFFSIQAFWAIVVLLPLFISFQKLWLRILIGAIFLAEWTHLIGAMSARNYYPGLWTAIPIVVLGVFFWRTAFFRTKNL